MVKLYHDVKRLDLRLVDLNHAIKLCIEPQVEEDVYRFSITKSSLIRSFILYRCLLFILDSIKMASVQHLKIVFFINPSLELDNLQQYSSFFNVCFRKLSKYLALSLYVDSVDINEILGVVTDFSGEGREIRAKIGMISNKLHKKIDLSKLDKLLISSGITKIYSDFLNDYKVKLGLYTT